MVCATRPAIPSPMATRWPSASGLSRTHRATSESPSTSMIEPLAPASSSCALCRITSNTASSSRTAFIALPACSSSESSWRRFERAAVRTRSSVRSLDSFWRCRSLSIAYTQKPTDIRTIPHRKGPEEIAEACDIGQIDSTTTPTLIETSMIEVMIHSWIRRCSTASSEGVVKSRRPTIRASAAMVLGRSSVVSGRVRARLIPHVYRQASGALERRALKARGARNGGLRAVRWAGRSVEPSCLGSALGCLVEHDDDVFQGRALREEPRGPRLPGLLLHAGVGVRGQDHDGQPGSILMDPAHRLDPVEVGHGQVHQHQIGLVLASAIGRFPTAAGLAGDLDPLHHPQRRREGPAEGRVVINHQHPQRLLLTEEGSSGKTRGFRRQHPARDPRWEQRPKWLNLYGPFGLWHAHGA